MKIRMRFHYYSKQSEFYSCNEIQELSCQWHLCQNKTDILPYCSAHLTGVRIDKSNIPEAGRGLFAAKNFAKGDKICLYGQNGVNNVNVQFLHKLYGHHGAQIYTLEIDNGPTYDCALWRYIGAFCNDPFESEFAENAEFRHEAGQCWIVAMRDIIAGEELFIEYGGEYWVGIKQSKPNYEDADHIPLWVCKLRKRIKNIHLNKALESLQTL